MNVFWLDRQASDVPPGEDWLTAGERRTLVGLRVPKRRSDWRLGRWTVKCAVAALRPAIGGPACIEVRRQESGAPTVFVAGRPAVFAVSLSHSGGRGFCVLAEDEGSLGCDVETVETRSAEFVSEYFTPAEQEAIDGCREQDRTLMVNALWSVKESASKALGEGLRLSFPSIAATIGDARDCSGDWREAVATTAYDCTFRGWWRAAKGAVWTVLGVPDPGPPSMLQPAAWAGARNHARGIRQVDEGEGDSSLPVSEPGSAWRAWA